MTRTSPSPSVKDVGARFAANLAALIEGRRHLTVVPDPIHESHPSGTLRTSRTPAEEAFDLREAAGASVDQAAGPGGGAGSARSRRSFTRSGAGVAGKPSAKLDD